MFHQCSHFCFTAFMHVYKEVEKVIHYNILSANVIAKKESLNDIVTYQMPFSHYSSAVSLFFQTFSYSYLIVRQS